MRRALLGLWLLLAPLAVTAAEGPFERGDAAWAAGDVAGALVEWGKALEGARAAQDHAGVVEAALRLAAAHRELGRVDTAAAALELAGDHARDERDRARIKTAEGQVALARGDPRRAEKLLEQAFEAHRRLGDPGGAATSALALGLARLARADLDGAWKAFSGAAVLYETLGDADGHADALTDLGITALRRGDLRAARDHLELAIGQYRTSGNAAGEADAAANLGRVLQELGRDDLAAEQYRAALAVARSRRDLPRQATLQQNLGALAHRAGDGVEASARYAAAEEAWQTAGRPEEAVAVALNRAILDDADAAALDAVRRRAAETGATRIEAEAALNLAVLQRRGDPAAATRSAEEAARLAGTLSDSGLQWRAHYVAGLLARDRGATEEAASELRQAVDHLERSRSALDAAEAQSFVFGHADVYRALIDLLLSSGDSLGAFVYAERLQRYDLPGADAPPAPEAEDLAPLIAEQDFVEARLATAEHADPASEESAALRERLAVLRVEFARTVDVLRAADPDFDRRVRVAPEDLEAIQAHLDPGVTVLQPILFDDRLVLLTFRRDSLVAHQVDVPGAEVKKTIGLLARALRAGLTSRPEWTIEQCDRLGTWLADPLSEELAHTEVLVVSPSGPFRQLPFAMVRHEGAWLVEKVAVVAVTHVGSLQARGGLEARFQVDGPGLLLVGNPDGTLPGAEAEVRAIAERYPGAEILLGEAGTEEAVEKAAEGRRALHLATHGRIDPERPDRSHLVLAGPDGRLAYNEIPGLAPWLSSCRLVVLSACESGLPVEAAAPADDEVIVSINGLSAQFRRAGVETLVASLWKVDDESTRALMVRFYTELGAGRDVARALNAAQREVLARDEWAHPWYWAAFVVMGDWR